MMSSSCTSPLDDVLQQLVDVLVGRGLAALDDDTLVEKLAQREVVERSGVHAQHRHEPAAAHGAHAGQHHFVGAFFEVDDGFGAVEQVAVGLEAHGFDAHIGAA